MKNRMSARSRAFVEARCIPAQSRVASAIAASSESDALAGVLYTFIDSGSLLVRRSKPNYRKLF